MPRSFLVKNKRSTSYNLHRPYEDEPEAAVTTGEKQNVERNWKKTKNKRMCEGYTNVIWFERLACFDLIHWNKSPKRTVKSVEETGRFYYFFFLQIICLLSNHTAFSNCLDESLFYLLWICIRPTRGWEHRLRQAAVRWTVFSVGLPLV